MESLYNALKIIGLSEEELISCPNRKEQIKLVKRSSKRLLSKVHPDVNKEMTPKEASANTRLVIEARSKIIDAIKSERVPIGKNNDLDAEFMDIEAMFKGAELKDAVANFSHEKPQKKEESGPEKFRKNMKKRWNNAVKKANNTYFASKEKLHEEDDDEREI